MTKLDTAEAKRVEAQTAHDSLKTPLTRNQLGQYATPPYLANAMLQCGRFLFRLSSDLRFLDPAFGSGIFFSALRRNFGEEAIRSATGFEIDPLLARVAKQVWSGFGLNVREGDFTLAEPPLSEAQKPNLIICNPPYVRHHHIGPTAKVRLQEEATRLGLKVSGLAGLYCYFLLLSHKWLATGGAAIWIIPAEFLDVNYGVALKQYLHSQVTTLRIHRFDPTDAQFSDALVTSVVVYFRNELPSAQHRIDFTNGGDLLNPATQRSIARGDLRVEAKWGRLYKAEVPDLIGQSIELGDLFFVKRGLATGANSFFILSESQAASLKLPREFLKPILPSQRELEQDTIDADASGLPIGVPRYFLLDCALPIDRIKSEYPALYRYLQVGEGLGIPNRYLPNSREPWYSQEKRPAPPLLCTYMGRIKEAKATFRFLRNRSCATAANVYLLLYPKPALLNVMRSAPEVIDQIHHELTIKRNVEDWGRVYGGGLNKVEPSELKRLPLDADALARMPILRDVTKDNATPQLYADGLRIVPK